MWVGPFEEWEDCGGQNDLTLSVNNKIKELKLVLKLGDDKKFLKMSQKTSLTKIFDRVSTLGQKY